MHIETTFPVQFSLFAQTKRNIYIIHTNANRQSRGTYEQVHFHTGKNINKKGQTIESILVRLLEIINDITN